MTTENRTFKPTFDPEKRRDNQQAGLRKKRDDILRKRRAHDDSQKDDISCIELIKHLGTIQDDVEYVPKLRRILSIDGGYGAEPYFDTLFADERVLHTLISYMANYTSYNVEFIHSVSRCLVNITSHPDEKWVDVLTRLDVTQVIFMHLNERTEPIICQDIWDMLTNICMTGYRYRDILLAHGLVSVMTNYISNELQLSNVCYTFHVLFNESPPPNITLTGPIIPKLLNALKTHETNDEIASSIIAAIGKMFLYADYRDFFIQSNLDWVVSYILMLYSKFSQLSPRIFQRVLITTDVFVRIDSIRPFFLQNNGTHVTASLLNSPDINVVKNALAIVHTIALDSKSFPFITHPDILTAMYTQSRVNRLWNVKKYLVLIFCNIFQQAELYANTDVIGNMLSMGILGHIVQTINQPDPAVQRTIVNTLNALITYPRAIEILDEVDGLTYLQEIMYAPNIDATLFNSIARIVTICDRKTEMEDIVYPYAADQDQSDTMFVF